MSNSIPALDTSENPLSLISEAVRGEGAVLVNDSGKRLMQCRHKQADLAPRDVVSREIFREKQRGNKVWLDARKIGRSIAKRFPGAWKVCMARGIDPEHIAAERARHPGAEFLIHPECGCATSAVEAVSAGALDPGE